MKKAYLKRDRLFYIVAGTTRLELATFPPSRAGRSNQFFYVVLFLTTLDIVFSFYGT